jgi:putative sterol carrier protein
MPHRPFTQPWADAFCAAVNTDEEYGRIGGGWRWPLALVLLAEPALGWPDDVAVQLELGGGRCAGARLVPAGEVTAPFALRGSYETWKRVVHGELDPVSAVMTGALRLTGSLATLMLHTRSARALVQVARQVDTVFPDEMQESPA